MAAFQFGRHRDLEALDTAINNGTEIIQKLTAEAGSDKKDIKRRQKDLALVHNARGMLQYRLIEFDKAIEDYTTAVQYDETLAAAYYNRGTIHYRMGCFDLAVADMKIAVSLQPRNEEFQKGLHESIIMCS